MLINLTGKEMEILRRNLEVELEELSHELHRTDSHEFRDYLHQKEQMLIDMLAKLSTASAVTRVPPERSN